MIKIYTDGATSNNGYEGACGGWAFIIVENGSIIHKGKGYMENATNNQCELAAIISVCHAARELEETVTIYSDSAYCINCYEQQWYKKWEKNGWINSKNEPVANQDLWKKLIPFFKDPHFIFKKVKGHSDNEFNNIVDRMAVEAKQKW